jgi:hypothetical protein
VKNSFIKLLPVTLFVVFAAAGCQKADTPNTNAAANANITKAASPASTVNTSNSNSGTMGVYSLASPSDAYRAANDARKKCDMPMLKHVMSQDLTAAMTQRGESDTAAPKTLDDMLKDLCALPPSPNGDNIKDEKIVGDEGTVKYQDENGQWQLMDFVRENGEWKLTMPRGKGELPALK